MYERNNHWTTTYGGSWLVSTTSVFYDDMDVDVYLECNTFRGFIKRPTKSLDVYQLCVIVYLRGDTMMKVNVKKDNEWGISRETMVIKHIGDEIGQEFKKLGKYDHFDYLFDTDT